MTDALRQSRLKCFGHYWAFIRLRPLELPASLKSVSFSSKFLNIATHAQKPSKPNVFDAHDDMEAC
jgi:hypothetical protein